jgi:uncharacterized protein YutE (UPF0331/DUF86 family)
MEERINEKLKEIEVYLEEIESWLPEDIEEYKVDSKIRRACERNFEVISEYVVDIALYIIKIKKLRTPNDDESTFEILAENKIISEELCKKMIEARGMRNFIAHKYGEIDDARVFYALKEQFNKDISNFIKFIKEIFMHKNS